LQRNPVLRELRMFNDMLTPTASGRRISARGKQVRDVAFASVVVLDHGLQLAGISKS